MNNSETIQDYLKENLEQKLIECENKSKNQKHLIESLYSLNKELKEKLEKLEKKEKAEKPEKKKPEGLNKTLIKKSSESAIKSSTPREKKKIIPTVEKNVKN